MRSTRAGKHKLLVGPPGSGKTREILEGARAGLRRGETRFRLLTPTATMAEHLRNQLAREGFTFPASCVMTLGRFVASSTSDVAPASRGALEIFVLEALKRRMPAEFQEVAALPGFRRLLCSLFEELASAGCGAERLRTLIDAGLCDEPYGQAVASVYSDLESRLKQHDLSFRSERLGTASDRAKALGISPIEAVYLDGFFQFTHAELDFIEALAGHASITVTLPTWAGAQSSVDRLAALGFARTEKSGSFRSPAHIVVNATTAERECEEASRRILQLHASGRAFSEIGIIVRSQQPYVPLLRATLERFGVPARFFFSERLTSHPAIEFLQASVTAMLGGWDHAQALAAITSSAAGLAGKSTGYEFEFSIRERLPDSGLASLKALSRGAPSILRLLELFERLDTWRDSEAQPRVWARQARSLRAFFGGPAPGDSFDPAKVETHRMQSAALDAFEQAIEEAVLALDEGRSIGFGDFWVVLDTIMQSLEIRVQDRRRNVVNVMDVYEARQWELPVTLVCGLVEKQFPKSLQRPVLFSDETRRLLHAAGIPLRTTADWALEEEFLFDLAMTRASELLILTYPEQNSAGDPLLRSFALDRLLRARVALRQPASLVRPQPGAPRPLARQSEIRDDQLLHAIGTRHAVFSPSSIESFLQCPFQFFARRTLKLRTRPEQPSERLSSLIQGGIIHGVLSRLDTGAPIEQIFEQVYAEAEAREHLVPGYRSETVKLEMRRVLRLFRDTGALPFSWTAQTEHAFEFEIAPDVKLRGRMDQLLIDPAARALVVDFKYSSKPNVEKCVKEHDKGFRVQGGLYMLAAEHLGYTPAGMLYGGLKKEIAWRGWQTGLPELTSLGVTAVTEEALRDVIAQSRLLAIAVASRVRSGEIAPKPSVSDKCRYCDYSDICRIETPVPLAATAGGVPPNAE